MNGSRIPPSYVPASWRCTLPIDPATQETGIGFTQPDGSVIRLRLSLSDAWQLSDSLHDYLTDYEEALQSDKSSGNPSVDGSPDEGQKQ